MILERHEIDLFGLEFLKQLGETGSSTSTSIESPDDDRVARTQGRLQALPTGATGDRLAHVGS